MVASFDTTHEEFVLACIAAGKPVLCEKPLATTADACLRVIDAELAAGRRLVSLGFMRRYDPGLRGDQGAASTTAASARSLLVHCAHRNAVAPPIYTSEMLITSSAVHEIDITRWLLGEEIVGATVRAPRSHHAQAPDGLRDPQLVLLETASGVLIDVEVFVNARYGYDIRCELVGETGTLRLDEQVAPDFRARFATAYRRELDVLGAGARATARTRGTATRPTRSPTRASSRSPRASAPRSSCSSDLRSTAERSTVTSVLQSPPVRCIPFQTTRTSPGVVPSLPRKDPTWLESSLPLLARCARTPRPSKVHFHGGSERPVRVREPPLQLAGPRPAGDL